ncbi:hypothetical protein LTR95_015220 [Oleoguttula sp. CCFEE 5521]
MSGAEVLVVLSVISSVIAIIDKSRQLYEAAHNAEGLHEAFRKVAITVPLVHTTLKEAEQALKTELARSRGMAQTEAIDRSATEVKPVFEACKVNVEALHDIFEQVVPVDEDTRVERYKKVLSIIFPGKKKKVEELMKEILEKLQLLHTYHFFRTAVSDMGLEDAIKELDAVEPSLPDDEGGKYVNTGSGPQNIHEGSGEQYNNTISGGERNVQYVAKSQTFGGPGH